MHALTHIWRMNSYFYPFLFLYCLFLYINLVVSINDYVEEPYSENKLGMIYRIRIILVLDVVMYAFNSSIIDYKK